MKRNAPNLAKRFPGAFSVAVIATTLSILLAVGLPPWGPYDRGLAVLTATLIGLIWYTFFTFCALHRDELGRLVFHVKRVANRTVEVAVKNPTVERSIDFQCHVVAWRDGSKVETPDSLCESDSYRFTLLPSEERSEGITVLPAKNAPDSNFGPRVQLGEPAEFVLRLEISWLDDLGYSGRIGPEYYAVDVLNCRVRRFQDVPKGRQAFIEAGGKDVSTNTVDA